MVEFKPESGRDLNVSASTCTTASPGEPETKAGRRVSLPARGMRGEAIEWQCKNKYQPKAMHLAKV